MEPIRRLARNDELNVLFRLHRDAFKQHVELLWGGWQDEQQCDNFREECAESTCEAILIGELIVGYVQHVVGPERIHIWNIALDPEFRSRGIGSQILRDFQEIARRRGLPLFLRVFPTNPRAFRFYQRLGFREISRGAKAIELLWRGD